MTHFITRSDAFLHTHDQLVEIIRENADLRPNEIWLTSDQWSKHELFAPIAAVAKQFVKDSWDFEATVCKCWGIVQEPGVVIPDHDHATEKYSVVYYILPGDPPAAIFIDDQRVPPESGLFVTFRGTSIHSVERNVGATDRIAIGMAFN